MTKRRREEKRLTPAESRKSILRHQRDQRERQKLLSVLLPVSVVCALFLAYGAYSELWRKPRQPVARVEGEAITAASFSGRVQYERMQLLNTLQSFQQLASASDPTFLTNLASGQRANIAQTTVDRMIDELLIRKEAERRGITVDDAAVTEYLAKNDLESVLRPTATPSDTAEPTEAGAPSPTPTPTATSLPLDATPPTPTPTADFTYTTDAFDDAFERYIKPGVLDTLKMSRAEFYDIVRQRVYREKLNEALGATLPVTDKQVQIEYLLFNDKATADEAAKMLADGAGWAETLERFGPTPTPTIAVSDAGEGAAAESTAGESATGTADGAEAGAAAGDVSAGDDAAPADGAAGTEAGAPDASGDGAAEATAAPEEDGGDAPPAESDPAGLAQADQAATAAPTTGSAGATVATARSAGPATATAGATASTAAGDDAATPATGGGADAADIATPTADGAGADAAGAGAEVAPADAVTPTLGITPTVAAPAAAPPTAVPNPFAFEKGEPEWLTVDGLKNRLGLNDTNADKVIALEKGKTTEALQSNRGYLVAHVVDADPTRELPADELESRRAGAVDKWLEEARLAKDAVQRYPFTELVPAEPDWFVQRYEEFVPSVQAQPTLDLSSIQVSTAAPRPRRPPRVATPGPVMVARGRPPAMARPLAATRARAGQPAATPGPPAPRAAHSGAARPARCGRGRGTRLSDRPARRRPPGRSALMAADAPRRWTAGPPTPRRRAWSTVPVLAGWPAPDIL